MNYPADTKQAVTAEDRPSCAPRRVRHDIRVRLLDVDSVTALSPHMVRVSLTGDLDGFVSLGFDDHVNLFFAAPGEDAPMMPTRGEKGLVYAEGAPRPVVRDYTPRQYDVVAGTIDIDFVVHDSGPATEWVKRVKPGHKLGLAGPRGSFIVPADFDWHLLIGDETALPAIARRLEELPPGARVVVFAEVGSAADELRLDSKANVSLNWVHRGTDSPGQEGPLMRALRAAELPAGDFYTWIACETSAAKALRKMLIAERQANPKWMRAAGYWQRGEAGAHEHIDE